MDSVRYYVIQRLREEAYTASILESRCRIQAKEIMNFYDKVVAEQISGTTHGSNALNIS